MASVLLTDGLQYAAVWEKNLTVGRSQVVNTLGFKIHLVSDRRVQDNESSVALTSEHAFYGARGATNGYLTVCCDRVATELRQ